MTEQQASKSVSNPPSAMALKQRLASLSPEKRAALQRRLTQLERSGYEPIRALPSEAVYPLSSHQRRLWFIEQFQPGTPLYNVTRAIRMRGPLNRRALKAALQSLIDRHEALRTTFQVLDGEPVQRINASSELQLPVIELRTIDEDRDSAGSLLQHRLTAEGRRVFDLSADLMQRAVLYQLADDDHVLQLTIHHLVCDGWSLQLLFSELAVLYRGFCSGRTSELPPIDLRYVDFTRWQREPQQRELFGERVRWWKRRLAGAPPVLELTTDRPRPQIESGSGAVQPLEIPSALLEQLEMLAREEDATLYMTLLAGFFILLHRYTGMEDFLVGSATAGRHRPETHGIVGFFVDTVVLRADISGEPTARQVLQRVRQTVVDAVKHSDVPLERIVESLDLPRDLSRHPLFQILFNAPPQYSLELHGLKVSPVNVDLQVSRFDLEMTYSDGANRTTGVTWNTDLFNADTIQRMLGHYCVLLQAIAVDADQAVHRLPLLSEAERHQLLVEWNDTAVEYPRDRCVHELFEQQVRRTPDAVAVVFDDEELSYRELNERANQLARYLRCLGVEPETLVGLCLDRSTQLVVAILGILKAGAAYVPLDADYPLQRLEFMLSDAKARFLVTSHPLLDRLPATGRQVVCLDTDAVKLQNMSRSNPSVDVGADNLAYVMYTSGSTGMPKGVAVTHCAISRLVMNTNYVDLAPEDYIAHVSNVSFDAATFEIWGALLCGGRLVISSKDVVLSTYEFAEFLRRHEVTTLFLTTSLFNQHVAAQSDIFASLKQVLFGGESVDTSTVQQLLKYNPPARLLHVYGPTENTTFTTWRLVEEVASNARTVPIGRPIANTQVYVLDECRQPVPIGVPGELYIGGAGLARGYLNRPELTAERFVANPFSDDPVARLYRSGDLCRWRADGNLEFLGRIDEQVKLRGFRIELGEIEAVLRQHAHVANAVVIMREDRPIHKYIAAYLIAEKNQSIPDDDVRIFLRAMLPSYMIPTVFITLEHLPLTPNGKVDRKALEEFTHEERIHSSNTICSHQLSELEQRVIEVWEEVLQVKNISLNDNFFDLGGHSMLAVYLIFKTEEVFRVRLPVATFFQAPTVAEFARQIQQETGLARHFTLVPTDSRSNSPPLFCVYGLYLYKPLAAALGPNQRTYGIYLEIEADLRAGKDTSEAECTLTVENIASRYLEQIREIQPSGPYHLAGVSFGGLVAFEIAHQLLAQGEKVGLLAMFDTYVPMPRKFHKTKRSLYHCQQFSANPMKYSIDYLQHKIFRFRQKRNATNNKQAKLLSRLRKQAMQKYELKIYPADAMLFRAQEVSNFNATYSDDLGWRPYISNKLDIVEVPGNHISILSDSNVHIIADSIKPRLIGQYQK